MSAQSDSPCVNTEMERRSDSTSHSIHRAVEQSAGSLRSEAMILNVNKMYCFFHVEEFQYLVDLFTSDSRSDPEIDRLEASLQ